MRLSEALTKLQEMADEHGIGIVGFKLTEEQGAALSDECGHPGVASLAAKPRCGGAFLGTPVHIVDPRPKIIAAAQNALRDAQAALNKLCALEPK